MRYLVPVASVLALLPAAAFAHMGQARPETPAPAASATIRSAVSNLFDVQRYRESSISPDGANVAWTKTLKKADKSDSNKSAIYVAPLNAPEQRKRVTAGDPAQPSNERFATWSPDSTDMVFLSDHDQAGQLQLYYVENVNDPGAGAARKLTSLKGDMSDPQFSPDGKQIAFLFTENAPRVAGPLEPSTPEQGVVDTQVFEQRLAVVDVQSGQMKVISPADMYVYEYDWSPNSREFVYTAAHGVGDNNWWIAKVYRIDLATKQARLVSDPPAQVADPQWSPDGKTVAFISGLMSDEGSTGGDIFLVPAVGGVAENITKTRKSSAAWVRWLPGPNRLLFGEDADGGFQISSMDTVKRDAEVLWRGDQTVSFGGVAKDGRTAAAVLTSWAKPPEVWAGKFGEWKQLTHANDNEKPLWGRSQKVHWLNRGSNVQGWLLYPAGFQPAKQYPMIVSVHGGPASQKAPSWPSPGFDLAVLASQGYFVFFPNPRGSYGQGEAFTRANVKDFGYGDLSDILTGVDAALKQAPIDPNRLGIAGWSYGGYMTMWTVTQTHRFRAAVAGAGIANWQSYYGQNLIDQWMTPYFGASVYDDPAVYAKSSPITYIKNVTTPTLVVVGDRDAECPTPQSREFWHALKTRGVKTQFVVYPNEGHHFNNPAHVEDVLERTISWFNANM